MKIANVLSAVVLLAATAVPAGAALMPVFQYQFPASLSSGPTTATAITNGQTIYDQSSTNNNAVAASFAATSPLVAAPPGKTGSSVNFSGNSALLSSDLSKTLFTTKGISDAGGFTFDVWFNTTQTTGTQKIIDRFNADNLRITNSSLIFYFSGATTNLSAIILPNQWYHVIASFNTAGNQYAGDPNYTGQNRVSGTASLSVNDVVQTKTGVTVSGAGDTNAKMKAPPNYTLSVGRDPNAFANEFSGAIYNPSVYLGTTLPEPDLMGAICLATTVCLRRSRRAARSPN